MKKEILSNLFFSILILILMIIAPMFIIKSMPIKASTYEDNPVSIKEDNNLINIEGNDKIKVYITKEARVEEIQIEEYVKSVVSGEMLVSFNEEALKAQAVAARTYVMSKRLKACEIAEGGDVCDTTHCQVYISKSERLEKWGNKGEEYWDKISKAVDATKGMVLSYNNDLVLYPQYFSTSSGMTENAVDVFSNDVPYLVSTESNGEEIAPKYETEFTFNINEFVNKINNKYSEAQVNVDNISGNIEIISRSDAGGIKEIRLGKTKVKGSDFRLAFGLSSTNFEYSIDSENVIFKCKGYGHGVGMSQWGANVMGNNGSNYKEILNHYYKGTELKIIEFKE